MKYPYCFTFLFILFHSGSLAQNGWLPPVTFPKNTNLCENNNWKLVFYDDFNGNQLDTSRWITYFSWAGMQGGDHDNWSGARRTGASPGLPDSWNAVMLDKNVVVSDGTCKLLVKHEAVNWQCEHCPPNETRYYSAGMIATPYYKNAKSNYFNSGKFEFRMKLPIFPQAHTTVWTWFGSNYPDGGINELDMVEAYGLNKNRNYPLGILNTYNLHAWGPYPDAETPLPNPNKLPHDAYLEYTYPNQDWINLPLGNYHDLSDWNTYTWEWDTASIKISLNSQLINKIWKYHQLKTFKYPTGSSKELNYIYMEGSGCTASGTYKITKGYPYNSVNSHSQLRITTAIDGLHSESIPTDSSTTIGQAEIDYIKIWQRTPEIDGHKTICNLHGMKPKLRHLKINDSVVSVIVSHPELAGKWISSRNLKQINSTDSSADFLFLPDINNPSTFCKVNYVYGMEEEDCPEASASEVFHMGIIHHWTFQPVIVTEVSFSHLKKIQFHFSRLDNTPDLGLPNQEAEYHWTFKYALKTENPNANQLTTFTTEGKYAAMPYLKRPRNGKYYIEWSLNIKTAAGNNIIRGIRTSSTNSGQEKNDSAVWNFKASIKDNQRYERQVRERLETIMADPSSNSTELLSMMNQVRMISLKPYLFR